MHAFLLSIEQENAYSFWIDIIKSDNKIVTKQFL